MEIKIQSIHFDATDQLKAFIEKKVAKLEKTLEEIQKAEVQLKVVKPATALNKEASISVAVPDSRSSWRKYATRLRRVSTSVWIH